MLYLRGSILGPLPFNISTLDMFLEQKVSILRYDTQYFCNKNLEVLLIKL